MQRSDDMCRGLFVTGTDTEIGKTIVACGLARLLSRRGLDVGVMKPFATGAIERDGELRSTDALMLIEASGCEDDYSLVNPICLRAPAAPTVAAREGGVTYDLESVRRAFHTLGERHDVMIVEGIGGLMVPVGKRMFVADVAREFGLPLLVVSRPGLGTINHTIMTNECARSRGLRIAGVLFNGLREAGLPERTNAAEIERQSGCRMLGTLPWDGEAVKDFEKLASLCEKAIEEDFLRSFQTAAEEK